MTIFKRQVSTLRSGILVILGSVQRALCTRFTGLKKKNSFSLSIIELEDPDSGCGGEAAMISTLRIFLSQQR